MRGEDGTDGDALLLAARELVQGAMPQIGQPQQIQGLLHALAHGGGRYGQLLHRVGQFLLDGVGHETVQRVLAHHAHHIGEFTRRMVRGVTAVDRDPPVQGAAGEVRHQAVDGAEQRRLADPGVPDDQTQLTLVHRQTDIAQHGLRHVLVMDTDLVEGDHVTASLRGDGTDGGTGALGGGDRNPAAPASRIAAAGTSGSVGQLSG